MPSSYNGFFKVEIESSGTTCKVINGINENGTDGCDNGVAGIAYYNFEYFPCHKETGIPLQTGYLCLSINRSLLLGWIIRYAIRNYFPDMTVVNNPEGDNTVEYPLAWCYQEDNEWKIQQLCYGIPHLFCACVCREELDQ